MEKGNETALQRINRDFRILYSKAKRVYIKKIHLCDPRIIQNGSLMQHLYVRKEDAMMNGQLKPGHTICSMVSIQNISWIDISAMNVKDARLKKNV